jgi:hypothetical protein
MKKIIIILSILIAGSIVIIMLFFRLSTNPQFRSNFETPTATIFDKCPRPNQYSRNISLEESISTKEGILYLQCVLNNTSTFILRNSNALQKRLKGTGIDLTLDQSSILSKSWKEGDKRFLEALDSINNNFQD